MTRRNEDDFAGYRAAQKKVFSTYSIAEPVARPSLVVLIPESTRKRKGGEPRPHRMDSFADSLPPAIRRKLGSLRTEVRRQTAAMGPVPEGLLPAYRRFDGNMYRRIQAEDWERRAAGVEVLIPSGLFGIVASLDTIPAYPQSMAEAAPRLGKLNRWWRDGGLPDILNAYLKETRPGTVVDLLSGAYREAVQGYADELPGIKVKRIDFPGMGRGSQPRRGETVAQLLRTRKV